MRGAAGFAAFVAVSAALHVVALAGVAPSGGGGGAPPEGAAQPSVAAASPEIAALAAAWRRPPEAQTAARAPDAPAREGTPAALPAPLG
ncbi:hypothetical protein DRV84_14305, partial [Rhodosalinus sediminis]